MAGVIWTGADGKLYARSDDFSGVQDVTQAAEDPSHPWNSVVNGYSMIADPNAPKTTPSGSGSGSKVAADPTVTERNKLKSEITGKAGDIENVYASLFGDLDNLLTSRKGELETQYGDQFKKAGDQYSGALPEIETSYAAIGAGDSTDNTYAKNKAKTGYEDTVKTIGNNKAADEAKLGQYGIENRAKFQADKESALRQISRASETTDVDALRGLRNDLESNLSSAGVTRATLTPDGTARESLKGATADAGRFEAAVNALDGIIKSSMSGAVKQAAVKAVTDNAGLSDEEKQKVQQQYGNVYAEQAAL